MGLFGKMFSKKASQAKEAMGKIENKDTVEAAIALAVWCAYADGSCEPSEVAALESVIKNESAFNAWSAELPGIIGNWIEKFRVFPRGAKLDALKDLGDMKGNLADAQKVLVIGVTIADQGGIDDAERGVLEQAATVMGLRLDSVL